MKVYEAQGFSREKALETAGLDVTLDRLKNATQAWKKAGSPMKEKDLNKLMAAYIKDKKAVGAYIVVEGASDDTRLRPYSVINQVTDGKRKAKTTYQIKEAELKVKTVVAKDKDGNVIKDEEGKDTFTQVAEVISLGAVEASESKKETAMKVMKELIEANKKDYAIEIVKEIVEGQKYAGYGVYTPSKSAKQGKFIFFVSEE